MVPLPCWWLDYLPAIRMSLMVGRHPIQHPPGLEVPFPVGNPLGMAAEDLCTLPCVTVWSGAPKPLLSVCSDSWLLMLLGREESTPQSST